MFKNDLRNRLHDHAVPNVFSQELSVLPYTDSDKTSYEPAQKRQRLDAGKSFYLIKFRYLTQTNLFDDF